MVFLLIHVALSCSTVSCYPIEVDLRMKKASNCRQLKAFLLLVGVQGFEPWTPWSQTRCATRLRHTPNLSVYCTGKIMHCMMKRNSFHVFNFFESLKKYNLE